jgi:hypothetical protein
MYETLNGKKMKRVLVFMALVGTLLAIGSLTFYYYPRLLKHGASTLEEKFRQLYASNPDFRLSVDELRRMVLDPDAPFDKEMARKLFNSVLRELGVSEIDSLHFNYGKSVYGRVNKRFPTVRCDFPSDFHLVVVQPKTDVEAGNSLEKVYLCSYEINGKSVAEVTLVFRNERSPSNTLEDAWYEAWRLISWGRSSDIETFFVVREREKTYVDFSGLGLVLNQTLSLRLVKAIGSSSKTYSESAHEEEKIEISDTNITIYVNTYNHALGLKDNNPGLEKVSFKVTESNSALGRRVNAENEFSDILYIDELVGL